MTTTRDIQLTDAPINGPTSATPIRNGGTNREGGVTVTEPDADAAPQQSEPAEPPADTPAS